MGEISTNAWRLTLDPSSCSADARICNRSHQDKPNLESPDATMIDTPPRHRFTGFKFLDEVITLHKHDERQVMGEQRRPFADALSTDTSPIPVKRRAGATDSAQCVSLCTHKHTHTRTLMDDPLGSPRRALGRQPSQQIGQDGGRAREGGAEMERFRARRQKDEGLERALYHELWKSASLESGMKIRI